MSDTPYFLIQQEPRLSAKEAENVIDGILLKLDLKFSTKNKKTESIIKNKGMDSEESMKYWELVNHVRKYGTCDFLQKDLDKQDLIFGNTFSLSTPNWQMTLKTEWAGYSRELTGPCRSVPSEIELSEDIEFYKEETCIESNDHDFNMSCRNYRGYLFSTIALIDCYINRHIIYHDFKKHSTSRFQELKQSRNTEQRIELFVSEFCTFPPSELIQSQAWSDFKMLKSLRNEVIHAVDPFMGIEFKSMSNHLNLSIHGVGTLLKKLQEGQGRISLGFIERVRTSPAINFNQITLRGDGNHHEKVQLSKIQRQL